MSSNSYCIALDPPTELCACVISQATSSTITVEAHWNVSSLMLCIVC